MPIVKNGKVCYIMHKRTHRDACGIEIEDDSHTQEDL